MQQRRVLNVDRLFNLSLISSGSLRKFPLLSLVWLLGLFFGLGISILNAEALIPVFYELLRADLTFFSLFFIAWVPFVLTLLAVYLGQSWLLLTTVFVKAFLIAFTYMGLFLAFEEAGWLLCLFCAVQEIFLLPLLWFLWIRILTDSQHRIMRYGIFAFVITVLNCCFSVFSIEPFVASLI